MRRAIVVASVLALAAGCGGDGPSTCPRTTPVGGACGTDCDCAYSICVTSRQVPWPEGYCTGTCQVDADCGAGGVCSTAERIGTVNFRGCLRGCPSASECRPGYACYPAPGATAGAPSRPVCVPAALLPDGGPG